MSVPQARTSSFNGVMASLGASSMWALLFFYATVLHPLKSIDIVAMRLTFVTPAVFLLIFFTYSQRHRLRDHLQWGKSQPWFFPAVALCAMLYTIQQLLFAWAPNHGKAVETSLGYFLMPLVVVFVGRVFFKEKLSSLQKLACILASLGVGIALFITGGLGWPVFVVALGFPAYFSLRRILKTDDIAGLSLELIVMFPLVIWLVVVEETTGGYVRSSILNLLLVIGLGLLCTVAMVTYTQAAKLLPFPIFGLLGYVEPVLLLAVSLLIGERIKPIEYIPYIFIWIAVLVLAVEGLLTATRISKH